MCFAAVGLIGSVISGIGAASQMSQQAANQRANANMQREQANQTVDAANRDARMKQREVDQVLSRQRAGYLSSGIALSGTPASVIEESAAEGAMDVAMIRYNAGRSAANTRYSARVSDQNASNASKAAPIAFLSPVIEGVAKYGSSFG